MYKLEINHYYLNLQIKYNYTQTIILKLLYIIKSSFIS